MEQKTEASQAVDNTEEHARFMTWYRSRSPYDFQIGAWDAWQARAKLDSRTERISGIPTWQDRLSSAFDCYPESECRAMAAEIADLRAALKAQPAPTEAAQGDSNSPEFDGIVAQGEDSVRLDWLFSVMTLNQFCGIGNFSMPPDTLTRSLRNLGEWARGEIDRARASAETGGVKS